jgi:hypothetical protein
MNTRHLMGMSVAALLAAAAIGGCQQRRDNAAVTADIRREMTREQLPDTITVAVADGVANLSGTVRDQDARAKAEDAAEKVSGVKRVVNNIRVTTAAGDAPAGQRMAPGYQAPPPGMPRTGADNPAAAPGSENAPGAAGAPR